MNRVQQRMSGPRVLRGRRVYLAGRYERRDELRRRAVELRSAGWKVTSTWLFVDSSVPPGPLSPGGEASQVAKMDLRDLRRSDVCISFTEQPDSPQGRGGRHFELGAAAALGLRTVIVGPREHVFHCLPDAECFETWQQAREHLQLSRRSMPFSPTRRDRTGFALDGH